MRKLSSRAAHIAHASGLCALSKSLVVVFPGMPPRIALGDAHRSTLPEVNRAQAHALEQIVEVLGDVKHHQRPS